MIEEVLSRENMLSALARVEANKGSHGVDANIATDFARKGEDMMR